jgi:hypothetical protein
MSRADYAHWNEDADYMWWHEEGKHVEDEPFEPDDDYGRPDYEELAEHDSEADCIAEGNFSKPSVTGIWMCDGCEREFPQWAGREWPPTRDEVSHACSERSSGQ